MRFTVWDRIIAAVSGLLLLVFGVGLFVFGAGVIPFRLDISFLDWSFELWQRAVMVVVSLVIVFFGLRGLALLFRSSKEKGFILQHTEYGDLSISMSAMENMVKKCVDTHEELRVASTRIHHAREGVIVNLRIALASGVNIPIAVSALQKQIKQYITSCSGVDVKEVRVMVETNNGLSPSAGVRTSDTLKADVDAATRAGELVGSLHEAAQNAMPAEPVTEHKPAKEPLHQRLFKREEKPQLMPEAPTAVQPECAEPEMKPAAAEEPEGTENQPQGATSNTEETIKEEV